MDLQIRNKRLRKKNQVQVTSVKSNFMEDEILKNIWNELSSKGKTNSEFETWKTNVYSNEEVQNNFI